MLRKIAILVGVSLLYLSSAQEALAMREPRPLTIDGRLKTMTYHPLQVYKFTGFFTYQTIIQFDQGEKINTVSVGLPAGWQIQPQGNMLMIKPIAPTPEDALTNMTIITDKRHYFFELHAEEAASVQDQRIPFIISFVYPDNDVNSTVQEVAAGGPPVRDKESLNYNYTLSGDEQIAPVETYDDGLFTYFRFRPSSPIPAFFEVDNEGNEGIVNYRIEGKGEDQYVVVESIISQYTLRYGNDVVCIFNESKPLNIKRRKK